MNKPREKGRKKGLGEDNPKILDKPEKLSRCRHGVLGLCSKCAYGERSHYQSRKGMIVERDVVDFIRFNKRLKLP